MVKMDMLSENIDNNHQIDAFNFDQRIDSTVGFQDMHNVAENIANEKQFDNRIAENEDEWNEFDFSDLFTLNEIMQFFKPEIFEQLCTEEKVFVMDMFRDKLAKELQLENPPEIIIADLEDEAMHGYYDHSLNIVVVNTAIMQDGGQVRDTVAHEIRHAWQHERAELPEESQNAFDKALKENFDNYISPEDNYRAYRSQLVEMDAREFAKGLVEDMYFSQE